MKMAPIDHESIQRSLELQGNLESIWVTLAAVTFLISVLICTCCKKQTEEEEPHVHKTAVAPDDEEEPETLDTNADATPAIGIESSPNVTAPADVPVAAMAKKSTAPDLEKPPKNALAVQLQRAAGIAKAESKIPAAVQFRDGRNEVCKSMARKGAVTPSKRAHSLPKTRLIPADVPTGGQKMASGSLKPVKKAKHFMGGNCLSTARNDMNAPVVIPATSKHTATVIFMHGLGDTGHGWAPVFQAIRSPHVKYICPTAPTIPVTLNMGMQMPSWFDIKGLNVNAEEDEQGIKKAAAAVHSWLDEEIKSGIPSDRILLGGFSQGGGLALYSAFTYDKALAGVVGLSCWLPLHKQLPGSHQANRNVPILQCHGDADPLVIVQIGQLVAKMLQAFNSNHTLKIFPGMGHSSCDQEIQDIKQFIEQRLPPK